MRNDSLYKGIIFTGLFALLFTPFWVTGSFLFPFIVGKAYFFRVITEIVFVVWTFLAISNPEYRPKKSSLLTIFSLFLISLAISTFFSPNPFKSFWSNFERMDGYITLIHLFLLFVVMGSTFKNIKNWLNWWRGLVFTSGIMCVYAFFQLAGKLVINQGGVRVDGTLGNAAYLATYLLFSFFTTLFLFAHEKKIWLKWVYSILGIAQLFVLYNTATRGATLGLIVGLLVMAIILAIRGSGARRKFGVAVLAVLLVSAGAFFVIKNTKFVTESPVLSRFASLSFADFKTQGRYFVWPMAIKGIAERPVFGWGIESFNYVFNKNYDPRMYNQEPWFDRSHNMFLDWLIAGGIVGGGLFIALCVVAVFKAFRDNEEDEDLQGESAAIITGLLVAYVFQGLFIFDNNVTYILFTSFLAFLYSKSETEIKMFANWQPSELVQRTTSSVLVLVLVFSLYVGILKPMKAGAYIIEALKAEQSGNPRGAIDYFKKSLALHTLGDLETREQLIGYSSGVAQLQDQAIKEEYFNLLQSEMKKQIEMSPDDARYRILYAMALNVFGRPDDAIVELNKAKELSPKKQAIYFEIAKSYAVKRDFGNALKVIKEAYDLEPKNSEAVVNLAVIYIYMGDDFKASEILNSMPEDYNVVFDDRILGAFVETGRWSQIIAMLEKRIEQRPSEVDTYISLASAYLKVGNKEGAINALVKVGSLRPDYKATAEAYIDQIRKGTVSQ